MYHKKYSVIHGDLLEGHFATSIFKGLHNKILISECTPGAHKLIGLQWPSPTTLKRRIVPCTDLSRSSLYLCRAGSGKLQEQASKSCLSNMQRFIHSTTYLAPGHFA